MLDEQGDESDIGIQGVETLGPHQGWRIVLEKNIRGLQTFFIENVNEISCNWLGSLGDATFNMI